MKHKILILDSYDCVGKTPFVKMLADKGFKTFQDGNVLPNPDSQKHKIWTLGRLLMFLNCVDWFGSCDMALDRFAMTELCYAPCMRGYSFETEYKKIEDIMVSSDIAEYYWIFLHIDNVLELKRRFEASDEEFVNFTQLLEIRDNYLKAFSRSTLNKILIDATIDFEKSVPRAIDWAIST